MIERPQESPTTAEKHAWHRWTQFSLPTLLAIVTLAAVLAGWWADRARLAERMAGFEHEQMVLRLAIEEAQVAAEEARSAAQKPASGSGAGAVLASPDVRESLHMVLSKHASWLERNCPGDSRWQEFLTAYEAGKLDSVERLPEPYSCDETETPAQRDDKTLPLEAPAPSSSEIEVLCGFDLAEEDPELSASRERRAAEFAKCLPAVVLLLREGDAAARLDAAKLLYDSGHWALGAAIPLARAADDSETMVRALAADALIRLGPEAIAAVPTLEEMLKTGKAHDAEVVIEVVRNIDPATNVAPYLLKFIADDRPDSDPIARDRAAAQLLELKPEHTANFADQIESLLIDRDSSVRLAAIDAYCRVTPPQMAIERLKGSTARRRRPHRSTPPRPDDRACAKRKVAGTLRVPSAATREA